MFLDKICDASIIYFVVGLIACILLVREQNKINLLTLSVFIIWVVGSYVMANNCDSHKIIYWSALLAIAIFQSIAIPRDIYSNSGKDERFKFKLSW